MTRKILSSALLFIIVAATVTFTALCDGWRSGHDGICTISALTPIYNSTMGVLLILGETWLVWVPVLLVLIAVVRHASKYIKKPAFWVTFTIVIAIIIAINTSCSGWNEGSSGACTIYGLTPVYNAIMGILLVAAFTGFIWVPALLGFLIIRAVLNHRRTPAPVVEQPKSTVVQENISN